MPALILALNWQHLGWTPAILINDGVLFRAALCYAIRGKRRGCSYTALYRQSLAISRMHDFWAV